MLQITAVRPAPPPNTQAVAIVCATGPWAWTLDSMFAVIGIVIAGLGAVATVLVG